MADNLTAEVGAIQGLANKVSGYASEVRGAIDPKCRLVRFGCQWL